MSDQNGAGASQNGAQDEGKGFKPFTESDVEAAFVAGDMDKLKEIAASSVKTIPGLYRRAKDAEEELRTRPAKPAADANAGNNDAGKPADGSKRIQDHADYNDLRFDGYNLEEATFIINNGGKAALNDLFVKNAIDGQRKIAADKKKSEDGTPGQDSTSPVYQKYTMEDMKKMSAKELEKILPHAD